jgi:hypothetical protein
MPKKKRRIYDDSDDEGYNSDDLVEMETGVSREAHENRNERNELPTGKMRQTKLYKSLYVDEGGRVWRHIPDIKAAFHQPMHIVIAVLRAISSKMCCGLGKVPNMKFLSKNRDGRTFSEVCCNRYTGELVIDPKFMGTLNFVANSESMKGHVRTDVTPHTKYGYNYKHIARGIPIGSITTKPIVLEVKRKK